MSEKKPILDGIKIIELGRSISVAAAGMHLADYGADVITFPDSNDKNAIDPVSERILARGKRVYKSAHHPEKMEDAVLRFAEKADILICTDNHILRRIRKNKLLKSLIICTLPAFSSRDMKYDWPVSEESIAALACMYEGPGGLGKPVQFHFPVVSLVTASYAINSIMLALLARQKSGSGQLIEIPHYDVAFYASFIITMAIDRPPLKWRLFQMLASPFMNVWKTKDDGRIYLHLGIADHLPHFLSVLKKTGFKKQAALLESLLSEKTKRDTTLVGSVGEAKKIKKILATVLMTKSAEEWEELLGRIPLCCGKIRSLNEWINHPASANCISKIKTADWGLINTCRSIITFEGAANCFTGELLPEKSVEDIPENWHINRTPFSVQEINTPPLKGIRVLDLTRVVAGPLTGKMLALAGAEVMNVRKPVSDQFWEDIFHMQLNGGKKSITLDMSNDDGKKKFWELISFFKPDVVIQNFSKGVAQRLGVGYQNFKELNESIIYLHLTGFDSDGIWKNRIAFEQNIQAVSGIQHEVGGKDSPRFLPVLINDLNAGLNGSFGIFLALYNINNGGTGACIRSSLEIPSIIAQIKRLNLHDKCKKKGEIKAFYEKYETLNCFYQAKDQSFFLSCDEQFEEKLLAIAGVEDDKQHTGDTRRNQLQDCFKKKKMSRWQDIIAGAQCSKNIRIIPRRKFRDVIKEFKKRKKPLVKRRYFEGTGYATESITPVYFEKTPLADTSQAPLIGGDTYEVFKKAGISLDGIRKNPSERIPPDRNGLKDKLARVINIITQIKWIIFMIKSGK